MLKATKTIATRKCVAGSAVTARRLSPRARRTLSGGSWVELPLYRVEDQVDAVQGNGPCVLEEAFFTCRIESGWRFEINEARDILVSRA